MSRIKGYRFSLVDIIGIGISLGTYFFYMKSKALILNYPKSIYYLIFYIMCLCLVLFQYKKIKREWVISKKDKMLIATESFFKIIIAPWFITGIILIPFNYFILQSVKDENLERVYGEIVGVSTYSKNRTVFFRLGNNMNLIYGYKPIMEIIVKEKSYDDYVVILDVRKSYFDTYVLNSWDIRSKE